MSERERKSGKYSKAARPVARLPHRKILEDISSDVTSKHRSCICCSNGSSQSILKRAQSLGSFTSSSSWGSKSSGEGGSKGLTASQEDEEDKEEGDFRRESRTAMLGQSSRGSSRQASSSFTNGISAAVGKIRAKFQGVKSRMSTDRAMGDNSQRPSRAVPVPGFFPTSMMRSSSLASSSLASSSSTARAKTTATSTEATATTVEQDNERLQSTSFSDLESNHSEDSGNFDRKSSSSLSSSMHWILCDGGVGKVGRESIGDCSRGADKPCRLLGRAEQAARAARPTRADSMDSTGSTDSIVGRIRTESPLNSKIHSPYDFSTSGSGGDLRNAVCLENVAGGRGTTATDPPAREPPLRWTDRLRNAEASSLPGDTSDIPPALTGSVRSMGSIPEESNLEVAASREGNQLPAQQGQAEVATFCGESLSASGAGCAVVACKAQLEINRLDRELVKLNKEMDKLLSQEDQIFADQIRRCFR